MTVSQLSLAQLFRHALPLAFVATLLAQPAAADVLDEVKSSGVLKVAVVLDYPPFGSMRADMKPEGYDIEVAGLLAKSLGVKAELVPVTSANKIPYIQSRKADVLLNIGANPERAKVVDFSAPYAPYFIGVFGPADIKVASIEDLKGKTIGTTRGSFEEMILTKTAPEGTDIKRYEDNGTTISAFLSGQTQLVALGNIVAANIVSQKPTRMPEQKLLLLNSPVRAAVLKGEGPLLEKVNAAIAQLKADGTLPGMAERWLKQPLPAGF